MSDRARWFGVALTVIAAATTTPASGYLVGPPASLEQLAASADVVCKATVVADVPTNDKWFEPLMGFEVHEAQLRVVSVLKGPSSVKVLRFHHYAPSAAGTGMGSYQPQSYVFVTGRSYLVLAASGEGGTYRQLSKRQTMQDDQGVLLAADDKPHTGTTLTQAAWAELRALLGGRPDDAVYAIREIDAMSGGHDSPLRDFDRGAALDAIKGLVLSTDVPVASAAIGVFGADSPYLDDRQAPYWLAGMGKGTISGIGPLTASPSPVSGVAVKELSAAAGGGASPALRALAIRALGRANGVPAATLAAWGGDADPAVRSAAVLVSAQSSDHTWTYRGMTDGSPDVRRASALAMGFSQDAAFVPELGKLLGDATGTVRSAAALSLLSFAPDQAEAVLKQGLGTDYRPLFVNALARKNPQPYLALLGETIEKHSQPAEWWGGMIPAGDSWSILFGYVKARPLAELTSGKLDPALDSLERMKWFSSSEPRDLYALYLRRGMTTRAQRFRAAAKKNIPFDMEPYFDMADKSPSTYVP